MDYKRIIKSENARYRILSFLDFIPDSVMIRIQYRIKMNRRLNLKHPKRYSEKLQWYKLHYRNKLMSECADKASVRNFVQNRGCGHTLNKCYGVYDSVEEICWESLPDSFVIKDTLGGGGRSMIFVHDKAGLDLAEAKRIMQGWLDIPSDKKSLGREWVYDNRKHRIIIEDLLVSGSDGDLPDYKFFCFDGKVFCLYFMRNYTMHHELGELGFFDRNFKLLQVRRSDFAPITVQPEKPENYWEMVEVAETLSEGFPHVRVDFYDIEGRVVFGEMTFFNASGYVMFEPDSFDYVMGERFTLPEMGGITP